MTETTVPILAAPQLSPSKRPRLSLQTSLVQAPLGRSVTALRLNTDPSSPTARNTMSNAFGMNTAISSPVTAIAGRDLDPKTAINTARPTTLRLETSAAWHGQKTAAQRTQTPGPFSIVYPDTPSSPHPTMGEPHTASAASQNFTPPQSAHPQNETCLRAVSFTSCVSPASPRTPRRRATFSDLHLPYSHPRSLHSILRNSPLPPRSTVSPVTMRRLSSSLSQIKRVEYDSPLTQTITTNTYVRSHIDLLVDEASPYTPVDAHLSTRETLDLAMADAAHTRDGGQTPGPFEEMRRRMAGLGTDAESAAARKRKRRDDLRQWRWTIGTSHEDMDVDEVTPKTACTETQVPLLGIFTSPSASICAVEMASAEDVPSASPRTARPVVSMRVEAVPLMAADASRPQRADESTEGLFVRAQSV